METVQYRNDVDLRKMTPVGYKPTSGVTGDANLVDYTPSKYDKSILISDLPNLENIRANKTNQQTWLIFGVGILVLVMLLILLGYNKKSKEKHISNINRDNVNDADLFDDYNDKNQNNIT